jgi:uncharacterized protein with FMN-binding domain
MKKVVSIVGVSIIALTGCASSGDNTDTQKDVARTEETVIVEKKKEVTAEVMPNTDETVSSYKDGTYTADGSYDADDGDVHEDIDFALEVVDGKVASLELIGEAGHPISKHHQEDFMAAMPAQIIGKDIADLQVETISGASDTTTGFKKALADIQKQAQQEA